MKLIELETGDIFTHTDTGFDDGYIREREAMVLIKVPLEPYMVIKIIRHRHFNPNTGHHRFDMVGGICLTDCNIIVDKQDNVN